jgi:predicted ATPase
MARVASFGLWLSRQRRSLDLTQVELAERVGCSVVTIQKIEADTRRPSKPLAECLGLDDDDRVALAAFARGQAASPAPTARITTPASLPLPPNPLLGREQEVAALRRRLGREGVRLLTLTGPGGVGKTHLALRVAAEVADTFGDGVVVVPLASTRDAELVASAVGQSLGLQDASDRPLAEQVRAHLREKHLLLVLDNFEHVLSAATLVGDLLAACPWLQVLVTSRVPLHLRAERRYPVPPLALAEPDHFGDPDVLAAVPAVALFVERAEAVLPDFTLTNGNAAAVAKICARLDGLPLAIELAAAWVEVLSPSALLARLVHRLPLLSASAPDMPDRHHTLRAAIAWSYDLLDSTEQSLFRRLGVFVGGCGLAAAEAVGASPKALERPRPNEDTMLVSRWTEVLATLASLVDKSLLLRRSDADGEPRFEMLETIREFALEHLVASGELADTWKLHSAYYLKLAEEAAPEMYGPRSGFWQDRLEREHDNLRAALRWAQESGDVVLGMRLGYGLYRFWRLRGHLREGRRWLAELLGSEGGRSTDEPPDTRLARARALQAAGVLARDQGDLAAARRLLEESVVALREFDGRWEVANALHNLGQVHYLQGDDAAARTCLERVLSEAMAVTDPSLSISCRMWLAFIAERAGDLMVARAIHEENLELAQRLGSIPLLARAFEHLGAFLVRQDEYEVARGFVADSLVNVAQLGDRWLAIFVLEDVVCLLAAAGLAEHALRLAGAVAALRVSVGARRAADIGIVLDLERWIEHAREGLSLEVQVSAWCEGQAMTLEQAIEYALGGRV